jgi:hypothetical protein
VKFVKLLTVPAVLLVSVLMAAPASAHNAAITNLTASCNSSHKVCFDFDVTTSKFDSTGRDILVDLVNTKTGQVLETLGGTKEHLTATTTHVHDCFMTDVSMSTELTINIRVKQPSDLTLGSSTTSVNTHGCAVQSPGTPTPGTPPPSTPTPSSSGGGGGNGGGSPTPSANTTVALAQTGGFDFRFPLIGLVLLVAGGAVFVVSASRGRSTNTK